MEQEKQNIKIVILNRGHYFWAASRKVVIRDLIKWIQDLQRLPLLLINNLRGRFQIKFGMTTLYNNGAFTLIELLVVVLIIGILTAVAVPQYQKAVKKAQLAELISTVSSITKAIDVWLLANGHPTEYGSYIWFTSKDNTSRTYSSLDIHLPCSKENNTFCYNHLGGWDAYCTSTSCGINLYTKYNEKGEEKNRWLDRAFIAIRKRTNDEDIWKLDTADKYTKLVCEAWKNSFGMNHIKSAMQTTCAEFGVE